MLSWLVLAVALAQGLPLAVDADGDPPAAAEAPEGLDDATLQAAVAKVLPLVEKHAGRPFAVPPKVTLAGGQAFRDVVLEENRLIFDRVFSASPPEIRQRLAEQAAWGAEYGVLGKYGVFTDTLYMSEGPLRMAASTLKGDRFDDVLLVILAHELTHALQDQHIPMDGLLEDIDDQDALWAASGSWEGFATWVEQQAAHELGLDDVFWGMTKLQGWGEDGLQQPLSFETWAVYGQGRNFVEHHHALGEDHLWKVLAEPPHRTWMLFDPARYTPTPAPFPVDFSPALAGTEHKLTSKKEWVSHITTLGDLELRQDALFGHTEEELDELMAHLVHAQKLEGALPDRGVDVRVMLFDDETWTRRYLELLRAQAKGSADNMGKRYGVPIELTYTDFPLENITVDDSTLRTTRRPTGGGRHQETRAAWVVQDRLVLVVRAENFRPGLRLVWAVEHLLTGLEAIELPE